MCQCLLRWLIRRRSGAQLFLFVGRSRRPFAVGLLASRWAFPLLGGNYLGGTGQRRTRLRDDCGDSGRCRETGTSATEF